MKKSIIIIILALAAIAVCNAQDTSKVRTPDSVKVTLSMQEYEQILGQMNEAIRLQKEARKMSEAATVPVYLFRVIEAIQERAKPVYRKEGKK